MFVTVSPGKETSSVLAGDQRIVLESTKYHVVRAVEDQPAIRIAFTSSESYAKSYTYAFTTGGRLIVARVSTDTGRKDLRAYDPRSGAAGKELCSFYSADTYRGFAIVGDRVYFRTSVAQDTAGRYRSGGDLAYLDMPCSGDPHVLVKRDRFPSAFDVHAAGGVLYAETMSQQSVDLWRVDTKTGNVTEFASLKKGALQPLQIFDGDDALYFASKIDAKVNVMRLPPDGFDAASVVATIPTQGKAGPSSIDASEGEVYVALEDPAPRTFLVKAGRTQELKLERGLYSTLIHGGGQILRIR